MEGRRSRPASEHDGLINVGFGYQFFWLLTFGSVGEVQLGAELKDHIPVGFRREERNKGLPNSVTHPPDINYTVAGEDGVDELIEGLVVFRQGLGGLFAHVRYTQPIEY